MKFLNVHIKSILILLRATICIFQIKNEYQIQVKKIHIDCVQLSCLHQKGRYTSIHIHVYIYIYNSTRM